MKFDVQSTGWVTPTGIGHNRSSGTFDLATGDLPHLYSKLFLDNVHPRFGRFDLYAKAGFGAIAMALRGAGLERWEQKRPVGLVVSTQRGCFENDVAYFQTVATEGGALASPNLFAYTLPTSMLGEASIQFGLTGPSFVVDNTDPGQLGGIHTALDVLRWGLCDRIIAGWCDVNSELLPGDPDDPCGAVFSVLSRTAQPTAWQWDGSQLKRQDAPVTDIEQLVRGVLENDTAGDRV